MYIKEALAARASDRNLKEIASVQEEISTTTETSQLLTDFEEWKTKSLLPLGLT